MSNGNSRPKESSKVKIVNHKIIRQMRKLWKKRIFKSKSVMAWACRRKKK